MATIYLILTHSYQANDLEIQICTTDYQKFKEWINQWGKDDEYDENVFDEEDFQKRGVTSFGIEYVWDRCVAYRFDIDIDTNEKQYALVANGYEYCWEGDVLGIYSSVEETKKAIIKATGLDEYCDNQEDIDKELGEGWEKYHCYIDDLIITYQCLPITIK